MGRITRIKVSQNNDYKMVKGQQSYKQVESETLPNLIPLFLSFTDEKNLRSQEVKFQSYKAH